MQALQVWDVAGDVEREYLALAFLGQLVAVGEPFQDQTALSRAVALAHEVLPRMRAATARGRNGRVDRPTCHQASEALAWSAPPPKVRQGRSGPATASCRDPDPGRSGACARPAP